MRLIQEGNFHCGTLLKWHQSLWHSFKVANCGCRKLTHQSASERIRETIGNNVLKNTKLTP